MSNAVTFWLGILISLPLALGVNLLTPRVQDTLGHRSRRRRRQIESDEWLGKYLASKPNVLQAHLQALILRSFSGVIFMAVGLSGIIVAVFGVAVGGDSPDVAIKISVTISAILGILSMTIGMAMIMNLQRQGLRVTGAAFKEANWPFLGEDVDKLRGRLEGDAKGMDDSNSGSMKPQLQPAREP